MNLKTILPALLAGILLLPAAPSLADSVEYGVGSDASARVSGSFPLLASKHEGSSGHTGDFVEIPGLGLLAFEVSVPPDGADRTVAYLRHTLLYEFESKWEAGALDRQNPGFHSRLSAVRRVRLDPWGAGSAVVSDKGRTLASIFIRIVRD